MKKCSPCKTNCSQFIKSSAWWVLFLWWKLLFIEHGVNLYSKFWGLIDDSTSVLLSLVFIIWLYHFIKDCVREWSSNYLILMIPTSDGPTWGWVKDVVIIRPEPWLHVLALSRNLYVLMFMKVYMICLRLICPAVLWKQNKIQYDTVKSLWYFLAIVFSESEGLCVGSSFQNGH